MVTPPRPPASIQHTPSGSPRRRVAPRGSRLHEGDRRVRLGGHVGARGVSGPSVCASDNRHRNASMVKAPMHGGKNMGGDSGNGAGRSPMWQEGYAHHSPDRPLSKTAFPHIRLHGCFARDQSFMRGVGVRVTSRSFSAEASMGRQTPSASGVGRKEEVHRHPTGLANSFIAVREERDDDNPGPRLHPPI